MSASPETHRQPARSGHAVAITRALENHPHMELVACPAYGRADQGNPVGRVVLAWVDFWDRVYEQEVTRWLRFDRAGIRPGTIVEVEVFAQQHSSSSKPATTARCSILVTHDPGDTCEFSVGDPGDPYAWVFGFLCVGAIRA